MMHVRKGGGRRVGARHCLRDDGAMLDRHAARDQMCGLVVWQRDHVSGRHPAA